MGGLMCRRLSYMKGLAIGVDLNTISNREKMKIMHRDVRRGDY
jgi:hypothetical protein